MIDRQAVSGPHVTSAGAQSTPRQTGRRAGRCSAGAASPSYNLLTSFDAQPEDTLIMVVNMSGTYYGSYPFWNAATTAEPEQLRQHLSLLPKLADSGLCNTAKDISMGGLAGTLVMLCEASGCGALLDLDQVPYPKASVWKEIGCFLLSVAPENVEQVVALFTPHGLTCQPIGTITSGEKVFIRHDDQQQLFWNLAQPLTGFSPLGKE